MSINHKVSTNAHFSVKHTNKQKPEFMCTFTAKQYSFVSIYFTLKYKHIVIQRIKSD